MGGVKASRHHEVTYNSASNEHFACAGQWIVTTLIQAVKLLSMAVPRLLF